LGVTTTDWVRPRTRSSSIFEPLSSMTVCLTSGSPRSAAAACTNGAPAGAPPACARHGPHAAIRASQRFDFIPAF